MVTSMTWLTVKNSENLGFYIPNLMVLLAFRKHNSENFEIDFNGS